MVQRKRIVIVGVILATAACLAFSVSPAGAQNYLGTVDISCTTLDAAGYGPHVLDRDNTGLGQERLRVLVTDGAGTVLYTLTFQNVLGTFAGGMGTFPYTTAPEFNPITATVTSLAGNGLAEETQLLGVGECPGLPDLPYQGVPVPSGFELHTIVCDVAVMNQPAGSPVGSNAIRAGQTWFVNPVPVPGADGQNWTEIFVAGPNTGFVPTSCVQ